MNALVSQEHVSLFGFALTALLIGCIAGGSNVLARVVRRSEDRKGTDRLDTSEFFQQVFENPQSPEPRVLLILTLSPQHYLAAEPGHENAIVCAWGIRVHWRQCLGCGQGTGGCCRS